MMKLLMSTAMLSLVAATCQAQDKVFSPTGSTDVTRVLTLGDDPLLGQTVTQNVQVITSDLLADKIVSINLDGSSVEDAIKAACNAANVGYSIEGDLPKDKKISLKIDKTKLVHVLNIICDAAGIRFSVEGKDNKTTIKVGKNVSPGVRWTVSRNGNKSSTWASPLVYGGGLSSAQPFSALQGLTLSPNPLGAQGLRGSYMLGNTLSTTTSTFNCPHCKKQATVIRTKQAVKCPKCDKAFQGDWQFCPSDGTKRPADSSAWKYCPMCGKQVEDKQAGVPVLKDIPLIGNLFRTGSDSIDQ